METKRESFMDHWRELSHWELVHRGRFVDEQVNDGRRKNKHIINSKSMQALRKAVSGMFHGTMSPSDAWFKLETVAPELMKVQSVQQWIYFAEEAIRKVFSASNLYQVAPAMLSELLTFGTSAVSDIDDEDNISHFYCHTVGTYYISRNEKGDVDTFAVKKKMSARQMVQDFGEDKVSSVVRSAYKLQDKDMWFDVYQFVEPNPDYKPGALENTRKAFRSVWFESGSPDSENKFLKTSGFDEFPLYVMAWSLTGEDIYGTDCPGMLALGDVKSLQSAEREKAIAIAKSSSPLLTGPASLRNINVPNAPNGLIAYDSTSPQSKLGPVYQIDPRIREMREDMAAMENRIDEAFFVNLFFAISSMQGIQPRNQMEIDERARESLLVLGPVLQSIQRDFQNKLVERTFSKLVRRELLPPPPPELEGTSLEVRFVSSLAHAQRSDEVATLNRHLNFVGTYAPLFPEMARTVDTDEAVRLHAMLTGTHPSVTKSVEAVQQEREAEAQAAQQAQAMQEEQQMASANSQNASATRQLAEAENIE